MAPRAGWFEPITRSFRPHAWAYGPALVLGIAIIAVWGAWWPFWPLMIWGLLFLAHFLIFKSLQVTDDWIDERTERTTLRAHDISHIESIRERYEDQMGIGGTQDTRGEGGGTERSKS